MASESNCRRRNREIHWPQKVAGDTVAGDSVSTEKGAEDKAGDQSTFISCNRRINKRFSGHRKLKHKNMQ